MRICDLIAKLEKAPAGARVFVETKKPVKDLLENNFSEYEDVIEISFGVKAAGVRKEENGEIGDFIIIF